jgi:hypothetical protein
VTGGPVDPPVYHPSMVRSLDLATVERRGGLPVLATDAEIDAVERDLGFRVPAGYRAYMTELGEGYLNDWLRVMPPWRIRAEVEEHRGLMAAFWFWDAADTGFGQTEAVDSIPIALTADFDAVVVHPVDPRLFVLPRDGDRVYARDPDLLQVAEWMCSAGVLRRFRKARYFEPVDSRDESSNRRTRSSQADGTASKLGPDPRTPRQVLMDYLREMGELEAEALAHVHPGMAEARDAGDDLEALALAAVLEEPPDPLLLLGDFRTRADEVRRRHCTARLASVLSGGVSYGSELEHDVAVAEVVDEVERPDGRIILRVREGREYLRLNEYTLERVGGAWRIATVATDWGAST